jgi:hypothetical protein
MPVFTGGESRDVACIQVNDFSEHSHGRVKDRSPLTVEFLKFEPRRSRSPDVEAAGARTDCCRSHNEITTRYSKNFGIPQPSFLINQGVMATLQERRLGYHSQAGLEPGTSRFSTLRINHYVAWGMASTGAASGPPLPRPAPLPPAPPPPLPRPAQQCSGSKKPGQDPSSRRVTAVLPKTRPGPLHHGYIGDAKSILRRVARQRKISS